MDEEEGMTEEVESRVVEARMRGVDLGEDKVVVVTGVVTVVEETVGAGSRRRRWRWRGWW